MHGCHVTSREAILFMKYEHCGKCKGSFKPDQSPFSSILHTAYFLFDESTLHFSIIILQPLSRLSVHVSRNSMAWYDTPLLDKTKIIIWKAQGVPQFQSHKVQTGISMLHQD